MRYREKSYSVTTSSGYVYVHINLPSGISALTENDIRLVVDETAKVVFCSSLQKDKVTIETSTETGYAKQLKFAIPTGKTVATTDDFTIEFDFGEQPSALAKASDIPTIPTDYAKAGTPEQGETAPTMVDLKEAIAALPTESYMKNLYAAHFESNEDGEDTYTMVMPFTASVSENGEAITITI